MLKMTYEIAKSLDTLQTLHRSDKEPASCLSSFRD